MSPESHCDLFDGQEFHAHAAECSNVLTPCNRFLWKLFGGVFLAEISAGQLDLLRLRFIRDLLQESVKFLSAPKSAHPCSFGQNSRIIGVSESIGEFAEDVDRRLDNISLSELNRCLESGATDALDCRTSDG